VFNLVHRIQKSKKYLSLLCGLIVQELHDKANIDYDHVAIQCNPSVASLYEDALVYETGTAITSTGALATSSGKKMGRSPQGI